MKKTLLTLMCLAAMMVAGVGLKAQEVTITLLPGWTWISYPRADTLDIATALGTFTPMEGDMIKTQYGFSNYHEGNWNGSVQYFYPGMGYMYYSTRVVPTIIVFGASTPQAPVVVTTLEPTDITTNSATSGGSITTDAYVFAKGICWATHPNPTQSDDYYSENGSGDESFTAEMTGLSQNTTYYVRAYAVTQDGIAYGNEVSFTTIPIWTIEAIPNPTEGGTITGAGEYEQNTICTLTAIANESYIFANWTENGEVVSTDTTYTFTVDASRTLVANFDFDHIYVDLGLPSGTLWATCNLGANLPEEYGDYFAWGETQPKDNFSWTNYQYCMGSFNTLTKYCNNPDIGYNGFTDDLTTLEPSDDAATANWGDDWRMPTEGEWQELYQNTTVTWTTQNGVNGRLFTASNGNSIFLPAAGYCNESIPEAAGIIGDYWTSSLDTDYPSGALSFFFNSSNYYISFCNRLYGRNVRAVRSGSQNTSYSIDATANPAEGGEVSGGGTYLEGDECTLTATANTGYTFANWMENDEVVSANATYTFIVNADRTLVANFTYNSIGNHTYVDLGLPSGLLWATCNVGADVPEDYGDYFAWAETHSKSYYEWSTYQYCWNSSYSSLSKYCNLINYGYNPYLGYGIADFLTTLEPSDDAATVNWGDNWRMPTKAEWQELLDNVPHSWTTQNGIYGCLFSASNGSSLFLPAAGFRSGSSLYHAGSGGYYWSRSLNTDSPYNAWQFYFNSNNFTMGNGYRCNGSPVRAVHSAR